MRSRTAGLVSSSTGVCADTVPRRVVVESRLTMLLAGPSQASYPNAVQYGSPAVSRLTISSSSTVSKSNDR